MAGMGRRQNRGILDIEYIFGQKIIFLQNNESIFLLNLLLFLQVRLVVKRTTPASGISPSSTAASAGREEGKVMILMINY